MATELFILYSGKDYDMVRRIINEIVNSFRIMLVEVDIYRMLVEVDIDSIKDSIVRSIICNETFLFVMSENSLDYIELYRLHSTLIKKNGSFILHIDKSDIKEIYYSLEKVDVIEWDNLSRPKELFLKLREWTQYRCSYNNCDYEWEHQLVQQKLKFEERLNAEKNARLEAERKVHHLEEELIRKYEEETRIKEKESAKGMMAEKESNSQRESNISYYSYISVTQSEKSNVSFWRFLSDILGKKRAMDNVYGSIYAPAEIKKNTHILIQVYLHLPKETKKVEALAQESDKNAERRDYIPLQCKLKKGDKVDVLLNIYGETLLISEKKSVVWQGSFTKCSFDYFVPKDIDVDELSCFALLSVNGVPVGEMRFVTKIVNAPRQLNPKIIAHKYSKVFISYSHHDESRVKFLHEGLELGNVPHFFDRSYLKPGDIFPQVIRDYIDSADLFILCWSENASKSEYVKKERLQALERAFPKVKPEKEAKLRIYPMSIEPRAELPSDMKDYYHFGEI